MKSFIIKQLSTIIFLAGTGLVLVTTYFYIPSSIVQLSNQIDALSATSSAETIDPLVQQYDQVLLDGLPQKTPKMYFYWYSNQRKLSDIRVKSAMQQISNTKVETGKAKIWTLLNMGAVIKTSDHTIAIDVANLPFSSALNPLIQLVDVFLVTHADSDHYDPELLRAAVKAEKQVVLPDGLLLDNRVAPNLIYAQSGEVNELNGVKVIGFQTDHRGDGNFDEFVYWYQIEIDGMKFLHTGDGRDFKNPDEMNLVYGQDDWDVLLGNILLHPYNIRDLKPKLYIPMHLYKFMSGTQLYQESKIEVVQAKYQEYAEDLKGIRIEYLLPGESVMYEKN